MYAGLGAHVADSAKPLVEPDIMPVGLGLGAAPGLGAPGGEDTSTVPVAAAITGSAPSVDQQQQQQGPPSFEDMYQSYRQARSGGYHAMIMANAASGRGHRRRPPPRP